jgi:hypothetical protein
MQVLMSPFREEVDRAHHYAHWVDIGIPSLRNLRFVSKAKAIIWILLGLSSIPLHLMFNSCIYEADATTRYVAAVVSEDFLHGGSGIFPLLETQSIITNLGSILL